MMIFHSNTVANDYNSGAYIENEMIGATGALVINSNTVVCTVIMKFSGTKHPIKLTITRRS